MYFIHKIFSWKYLAILIAISLFHLSLIMRDTKPVVDRKLLKEKGKKSWLIEDETVSEYHEPAKVYRCFNIYKFDPKTREDDSNWVIEGSVDVYGQVVINYHYRVGAMIV